MIARIFILTILLTSQLAHGLIGISGGGSSTESRLSRVENAVARVSRETSGLTYSLTDMKTSIANTNDRVDQVENQGSLLSNELQQAKLEIQELKAQIQSNLES